MIPYIETLAPWIALLAAAAGCVMASLYIALNTVARAAVEEAAAKDNKPRAMARVERILDDTATHARAVGLLMMTCHAGVVWGLIEYVHLLRNTERPTPGDAAAGVLASIAVLWVTGVLAPMSIANHFGTRLIYRRSLMLRAIERAFSPFSILSRFIDEVVRRLTGAEVQDAQEQVEAELLSVVEEGEQRGAIDERDREMFEGVMRFRTLTVQQIMTPRTEMEALEYTNNLGMVTQTIKKIGHSRIPVYEESLDHIIGIFYVKDLMKWLAGDGAHGGGKPFDLRSILRSAVFVPETKTVRELLEEMIQKKVHIALVADEYGGTAGLVTIEDIVEEIIGDIKDEYEVGPVEMSEVVLKADQHKAEVDGAARIGDVNDAIAPLGVEIPESEEYDTVGGFVITTLGRIPAKGETFQHERMVFTIMEAKPTRVVKISLEVRPEEHAADAAPEIRPTTVNGAKAAAGQTKN